jgi:hypothetical protein
MMGSLHLSVARSLFRTGPVTTVVALLVISLSWASRSSVDAQTTGLLQQAVGGVSINSKGMMENADIDATHKLRQVREQAFQQVPGELQGRALRKVSLVRLERAIQEYIDKGKPLSDAMKYLAGLQQIDYVLVYPEQHDIVLAGPGEGWKLDARGDLVGATTGRPVMLLDDLLVALRTAPQALQSGISCSIDPTNEGLTRLRQYVSKLHTIGSDPQATADSIGQTLGPQRITVTGVPTTSHFARVLVAADYRMKRIAMNFEPSPVRSLPSFLQMMQSTRRGMNNMMPRWWLEPDFQPLLRDRDGLSWQLRGAAVKALTEEDYLLTSGAREHSGKANPTAQRWADLMTAKYDELAVANPIFGQLRNCMELAIVAALVSKENLPQKAGAELSTLLDSGRLEVDQFAAPQQVDSQASVLRKGNNWVISASGGVKINPWAAAQKSEESEALAAPRSKAIPTAVGNWWWN